jgi:exosome complex exonuclease RRP6
VAECSANLPSELGSEPISHNTSLLGRCYLFQIYYIPMEAGPSNASNFETYNARLLTSALNATRMAAGIPSDVAFHRSMDSGFAHELDAFTGRVLSVTNRLLSLVSTVDQSRASKGKARLGSQDDVVDNFYSLIVDATDQLLERTVRIHCVH